MTLPTFDRDLVREFLQLWENCDATADLEGIAFAPTVLTGDGDEVPRTGAVSRRYCRFLYTLVALLKPQRALEIGLANGVSAAFIASAIKTYQPDTEGAHVVLDPFQESQWRDAGRAILKRLELDSLVRVIEDYSYKAIPRLEDEGERFDFVFVDGNHCLDYLLSDVVTADRVLNPGGLLVLDDSIDFGVALAIPYLDRYRPNLRRIRFDNSLFHWLREHVVGRRRLTVYQKIGEDKRGPDAV